MRKKQKPGDGPGFGLGDNGGQRLSVFNFSTDLPGLQAQAKQRMQSDPARYGSHFLIWLSLNALKNGWRWPGGAL